MELGLRFIMRIQIAKNISGWNDPGWALLLIGMAAWMSTRYLRPLLSLIPPCMFHRLTGWPCPACGSTRAGIALASGEMFTAAQQQPLFVIACIAASVIGVHSLVAIASGRRISIELAPRERAALRYGAPALILLNWFYLVMIGI